MTDRRWVDDKTTDEPLELLDYRRLNLRCRRDRALSGALLALLRETVYCRREGCRVVAAGVKDGKYLRLRIRHHKWCLAGRDALAGRESDSIPKLASVVNRRKREVFYRW